MIIGVPKESLSDSRVALVPESVKKLVRLSFEVVIEKGAGERAFFSDEEYAAAGAKIASDSAAVWNSDIVLKVAPPEGADFGQLKTGAVFAGFLAPLADPTRVQKLNDRKVTAIAMELVPRTTRAQSMDALSSQANVGGYKAVLLAAGKLGKYFPMLTTAAGTVPPAKVLIIGAGVAGLQAIATARRLGAVVEAYDVRPEVKEQVQSLGAKYVEADLGESGAGTGGYAKELSDEAKVKLQQALADRVAASDVVITTAQVPGKKAPRIITVQMLNRMKPGSVVVDMAAGQGGNVEGSAPDTEVQVGGVLLLGPTNLPSTTPTHASQLYSRNLLALLEYLAPKGAWKLDLTDPIMSECVVCHAGEIRNTRVKAALSSYIV